jgi:hypothetical protein
VLVEVEVGFSILKVRKMGLVLLEVRIKVA